MSPYCTRAWPWFALGICIQVASARAQTLTGLGPVPGGASSTAYALSRDGSAVVGYGYIFQSNGVGVGYAFRWSRTGGMVRLPAGGSSIAKGVGPDGQVVVGISGLGNQSFRWTQAGGIVNTGILPGGSNASLLGANGDGSILIGISTAPGIPNFLAVQWTPGGGLVSLGTLPGDNFSAAQAITPDGSVIVGWSGIYTSTVHAVRWSGGSITDLGTVPGASGAFARSVSSDGSVIVGRSGNSVPYPYTGFTNHAFRWTASGGMEDLHSYGQDSDAWGVSDDGSVVGGSGYLHVGPAAWMWTQDTGMANLNAYLPTVGIDTSGWNLRTVRGVSADGRTIAGTGWRAGSTDDEAWIANLPAVLPACFSLGPIQVARGCPPGAVSLSVSTTGTAPYGYRWQQQTTGGPWQDMAANSSWSSPTTEVHLRPGPGVTTYAFRVIAITDCTTKTSEPVTYTICRADYDCDGRLAISDIFAYLNAWLAGDYRADFEGTGPASPANILAFLADWFAGC